MRTAKETSCALKCYDGGTIKEYYAGSIETWITCGRARIVPGEYN